MDIHEQIARTLSVVRELAQGNHISTQSGTIAMGSDGSIGWIMHYSDGDFVTGDLSFSQLNKILEANHIGMVVPMPV
jgi:hypothetical protein